MKHRKTEDYLRDYPTNVDLTRSKLRTRDFLESKRGLALASFICATMWLIIVILSAGTFDK